MSLVSAMTEKVTRSCVCKSKTLPIYIVDANNNYMQITRMNLAAEYQQELLVVTNYIHCTVPHCCTVWAQPIAQAYWTIIRQSGTSKDKDS